MQGYTVSSRYDSDDYDELLALSCDACSEQVRQNMLCTIGISHGALLVSSQDYVVTQVVSWKEPYDMRSFVIPRQPVLMPRSCLMSLIGGEMARFKIRKALCSDIQVCLKTALFIGGLP